MINMAMQPPAEFLQAGLPENSRKSGQHGVSLSQNAPAAHVL